MSTRRDFIKQLGAVAGLGAAVSIGLGLNAQQVRAALAASWYMPDENELQERVFLAFAASSSIWADWAGAVNNTIALLAKTIAKYQPVTVLCRPAQLAQAKSKCGTRNIRFISVALDDI